MTKTKQTVEIGEIRAWRVHGTNGESDRLIKGRSLREAAVYDFRSLISGVQPRLGSAAGYKIDRVTAQYRPEILGGKGGVEVVILSHGLDLAHRPVSQTPHTTTVWIHAGEGDL